MQIFSCDLVADPERFAVLSYCCPGSGSYGRSRPSDMLVPEVGTHLPVPTGLLSGVRVGRSEASSRAGEKKRCLSWRPGWWYQ